MTDQQWPCKFSQMPIHVLMVTELQHDPQISLKLLQMFQQHVSYEIYNPDFFLDYEYECPMVKRLEDTHRLH